MKALVETIAKAIAESPDQVSVLVEETQTEVKLTLKVADADKGKVIGKQGKVIKAVRQLLSIAAAKHNRRVSVDVA